MKKIYYLTCCWFLLLGIQSGLEAQQDYLYNQVFSKEQLQEDFLVLRSKYENSLTNLYLYQSKEQINSIFDSLYQHIEPMTERDFFNYVSPLMSIIKDGHSIILPSESTTEYHKKQSLFFPLKLYWDNKHLYLWENYSNDSSLKSGAEILSINGINADSIVGFLLNRQVRDGYNLTYPCWILNTYFRSYYNMSFGYPESYQLTIKSPDHHILKADLAGVRLDTLKNRQMYWYELDPLLRNQRGIDFSMKGNTGILTLKTWDKKILKDRYHQHFETEIDHVFNDIQKNKITDLIIDLRDNQGGDSEHGDYLLGYLLDHDYQYFAGIEKLEYRNQTTEKIKSLSGPSCHVHHPKENSYKGKLYILINGGSFSNSGIFSSRLRFYQRGIFIGEETGGNKTVLTGVFGLGGNTILPNTKLIAEKANHRILINQIELNDGHGLYPEITLKPTIEDLIIQRDIVLEYAQKIIKDHH